MIVYFDESYDNERHYLLASGLLFALAPAGLHGPLRLVSFSVAAAMSLLAAITLAMLSVLPRRYLTGRASHVFAGDIALYRDAKEYMQSVTGLSLPGLSEALCIQIYVVASIANRKLAFITRAFPFLTPGHHPFARRYRVRPRYESWRAA